MSGADKKNYPLLFAIDHPRDMRALAQKQLPDLADEIRRFLIEVTSTTGGHLAPGLGTVELTLALHYVFDTPNDRLVWDIGHQAYPHKLITGRRDSFHTLRQHNGISGFLKRSESEFDTFGAGHAGTSVGAALGMAVAARIKGDARDVVAVIGDGALTSGMAFEALNNAGDLDANLLVVLNDNEMSISKNVGAISNYLARILSGRAYTSVREGSKTVLSTLPPSVKSFTRRWEEHLKGMVMPGTLFEELGFYYIGPVDGHNLNAVIATLKNMRGLTGPRFLHLITQKGKGYKPAEGDPLAYHGVTPFNPDTGKMEKKKKGRTYTNVFGDWLCAMAARDDKLVGITPAMREGSGLVKFSQQFPDRYFDVGIAEQHALTFAAGLAADGFKPVVAIYSTFLQRAYDQLIHDIAIQNLDVTLAIDRAGLVGADGETHAGAYDFAYLRCVPGLVVMAPADEAECRDMLFTAYCHRGPAAVRYPRGGGPGVAERDRMRLLPVGKAEVRRRGGCGHGDGDVGDGDRGHGDDGVGDGDGDGGHGDDGHGDGDGDCGHGAGERDGDGAGGAGAGVAILAFGAMVTVAEAIADKLDATVVNMRFVKPLDEELIVEMANTHALLVTLEEHTVAAGAGSAVGEALRRHGSAAAVIHLGLPDRHLGHGTQTEQLAAAGLDPATVQQRITQKLTDLAATV